jgi:hypothetical protein
LQVLLVLWQAGKWAVGADDLALCLGHGERSITLPPQVQMEKRIGIVGRHLPREGDGERGLSDPPDSLQSKDAEVAHDPRRFQLGQLYGAAKEIPREHGKLQPSMELPPFGLAVGPANW